MSQDSNSNGRVPKEDLAGLRLESPSAWAAGLPAVLSSFEHILSRAGAGRGVRALRLLNQVDGFDCPSCAWPDPDDERPMAEFCENGAKAVASEAMKKTIGGAFFETHSVAELSRRPDVWHDAQGRLAEPLFLDEGASHYRALSWEDAFALVAEEIQSLASADEAILYTSGRASNEAAFQYGLFARALGTNNLPDCSNMCHESSGTALSQAIGIGKGTVSLDDLAGADVILCAGQNPGTNHPRMLTTLERAVERGAHLVAINPLKEAGLVAFANPQKAKGLLGRAERLSAAHLPVRVNGDMALFRGLAKALFALEDERGGVLDADFIASETDGFGAYEACVRATAWSLIETQSGIARAQIEALAEKLAAPKIKLITCWAMGLTQHHNSVATLREVTNVHLLLGALGRQGAGLCPVRGHSNVQGDRTVGICEKMPDAFFDKLDATFERTFPRQHGHDTVAAIRAMHAGDCRVFISLGGNFLQASPDTDFVAEALSRVALTCHISTKLNRTHLCPGKRSLILPCLGRSERDMSGGQPQIVSCENSMGIVQSSSGRLPPASPHLRSEVGIICGIAAASLGDKIGPFRWSEFAADYDGIRSAIESVVPGFNDYNARVREGSGFYLPNSARERVWNTPTKKANFGAGPISAFSVRRGHFILQTLRSHDQFNTTIYGTSDRYRGVHGGRRIVFMNAEDMKARDLRALQPVDLTSHFKGEKRHVHGFALVPYDIPRGTLAAYFPEANPLVPLESYAAESHTPTSKSIEVSVRASETSR